MSWLPSGQFQFLHPGVLWLLLLLPALALWRSRRGAAPAIRFSSTAPLAALGRPRRAAWGGFRLGLLLLGLGTLILALARPVQANSTSRIRASGIDILLTIDVSPSMLAQDISIGRDRANRLEAVKKVAADFITARPNDRIGMVAFSGRPYLVSPLTLDHDWLLKNLDRLRVGMVEKGTAIGLALASAANKLKDGTAPESKSKIIVLLTDGGNNAGSVAPLTAAEAAHALGFKIYTIGVGSDREAPIPLQDVLGRTVYQMIPVDVDIPSLEKIAEIGQGAFFRATDGSSLQRIFEKIDQLEKTTVEASITQHFDDLFPWFLGAGALLITFHLLRETLALRRLP